MAGGSSLQGYGLNSVIGAHSFVGGQVLNSYSQLEVQALGHAGYENQTVTFPGNPAHGLGRGGCRASGTYFPPVTALPFLDTPGFLFPHPHLERGILGHIATFSKGRSTQPATTTEATATYEFGPQLSLSVFLMPTPKFLLTSHVLA